MGRMGLKSRVSSQQADRNYLLRQLEALKAGGQCPGTSLVQYKMSLEKGRFQYKMSLSGPGRAKLGIAHSHAGGVSTAV
jgi:hypothetical protein